MMRLARAILAAALLATALSGCSSDDVDWRAELIDISQSEWAEALYYPSELDANSVDDTIARQCRLAGSGLEAAGTADAIYFDAMQRSIASQRGLGVPNDLIRRDFAAMDHAMAELCPQTHDRLSTYFGLDNFGQLVDCSEIPVSTPAGEISGACTP